jgi:hypothetical protein
MATNVGSDRVLAAVKKGSSTPKEIMEELDLSGGTDDQRRRRLHSIRNALDHLKKNGQVELDSGHWSVTR